MNPNTPTMTVHRARNLYAIWFGYLHPSDDTIKDDIEAWQDAGGYTYCTFAEFVKTLYHYEEQDTWEPETPRTTPRQNWQSL